MSFKRERRTREMRPVMTEAQLEFLRTGRTNDLDVFVDWGPNCRDQVRAAFEEIREDFAPGYFAWAEAQFGPRP